jgi:hypothetical protein
MMNPAGRHFDDVTATYTQVKDAGETYRSPTSHRVSLDGSNLGKQETQQRSGKQSAKHVVF